MLYLLLYDIILNYHVTKRYILEKRAQKLFLSVIFSPISAEKLLRFIVSIFKEI